MPTLRQLARPLALALLAGAAAPAHAQTEPAPPPIAEEPWQPRPGFFSGWARAGVFLPSTSDLSGARTQASLGIGFGVGLLPFATAGVEASWTERDFADPGGGAGRVSLESRGLAALVRLHRAFWRVEPSVTVGAIWLESRLNGTSTGLDGTARGFGLVAGAGLDLLLSGNFSVGLDWRWLQADGRFPDRHGAATSLSGQSAAGVVRIFWP